MSYFVLFCACLHFHMTLLHNFTLHLILCVSAFSYGIMTWHYILHNVVHACIFIWHDDIKLYFTQCCACLPFCRTCPGVPNPVMRCEVAAVYFLLYEIASKDAQHECCHLSACAVRWPLCAASFLMHMHPLMHRIEAASVPDALSFGRCVVPSTWFILICNLQIPHVWIASQSWLLCSFLSTFMCSSIHAQQTQPLSRSWHFLLLFQAFHIPWYPFSADLATRVARNHARVHTPPDAVKSMFSTSTGSTEDHSGPLRIGYLVDRFAAW